MRLTSSLLIPKSHLSLIALCLPHSHCFLSALTSHCFLSPSHHIAFCLPQITFRRSVAFSGRVHPPHEDLVDRVCFKTLLLRNILKESILPPLLGCRETYRAPRSDATVRFAYTYTYTYTRVHSLSSKHGSGVEPPIPLVQENSVLQTTENITYPFLYITSFPRTICINLTTSFVRRCVCIRSARGVSAKTQMLLTATFLARYTDLITGEFFLYTLSDKLLCGSVGATNLDASLYM